MTQNSFQKTFTEDYRELPLWIDDGENTHLVCPYPRGRVEVYKKGDKSKLIESRDDMEFSLKLRNKLFCDWTKDLDLLPVLPWHFNWQSIHDIRRSGFIDIDDYLLAILIQYAFDEFTEMANRFNGKYHHANVPRGWGTKIKQLPEFIADQLRLAYAFFAEHNKIFEEAPSYYCHLYKLPKVPAWEMRIHYKYLFEAKLMEYFPFYPFLRF